MKIQVNLGLVMKKILVLLLALCQCCFGGLELVDSVDEQEFDLSPKSPSCWITFWLFSGSFGEGGIADDPLIQQVMQKLLEVSRVPAGDPVVDARIRFAEGMIHRAMGNHESYLAAMKDCAERIVDEVPFAAYMEGCRLLEAGQRAQARLMWKKAAEQDSNHAKLCLALLDYEDGQLTLSDLQRAMENMWRPHMSSAKYTDTAYWLEIIEKHHVPLAGLATYLKEQAAQGNMRAKVLYIALCYETILITDAYDYNKMCKIYYHDESCQKNQMMKELLRFAAMQHSAAYNAVFRKWAQYTLSQQTEKSSIPKAGGMKPSGACVSAL